MSKQRGASEEELKKSQEVANKLVYTASFQFEAQSYEVRTQELYKALEYRRSWGFFDDPAAALNSTMERLSMISGLGWIDAEKINLMHRNPRIEIRMLKMGPVPVPSASDVVGCICQELADNYFYDSSDDPMEVSKEAMSDLQDELNELIPAWVKRWGILSDGYDVSAGQLIDTIKLKLSNKNGCIHFELERQMINVIDTGDGGDR